VPAQTLRRRKICGKSHGKCALLAGTAGTQPAHSAGTKKLQILIFPRLDIIFLRASGSIGKF